MIATRFRRAAMGLESWDDAALALAHATGGHIGQLAALDEHGNAVVHVIAGTTPDVIDAFAAERGFDPGVNPRTRAMIAARPLQCVREEEFATPEVIARSPIYQRLFRHVDAPTSLGVRLDTRQGLAVAATVQRPRSSGATRDEEARLMTALAPAMAEAVLVGMVLGTTANHAAVTTAERLTGPALVLGPDLNILSLSPTAEELLRTAPHFAVRRNRVTASDRQSDERFRRAFAEVTASPDPGAGRVAIAFRHPDAAPIVADLCALTPGSGTLGGARALLAIRAPRAAASGAALRHMFDLTPAEAEIALALAAGQTMAVIAAARGSRVETVRGQVKSLFAKTGTHRQAELVALVAAVA